MLILKKLNRKLFSYLSLVLLVTTLLIFPPAFLTQVSFLGSPTITSSVNAQTNQPESKEPEFSDSQQPKLPLSPEEQGEGEEEAIDFFKMAMGAIAGLVLFIYGVTRLAEGLEDVGEERMKRLLSKFTTNRFAGVATGIVATTFLESSSVTIILVIAMVSASILTFVQSLGVVLGSNIGTAVGAQIISLNIELYVPILMFSGLLVFFLGKTARIKSLGIVLLGFGLMFYGLEAIDSAMEPFRDYEPFLNLMESLGRNPVLGALLGAIFTVIIQSSSATVAIVVTLAGSGLIALPAGIAIMLGAEVGTCADTLVATIGRGSAALRTGLFHLFFNLSSAVLGIFLAPQLAQLTQSISGDDVGRQVANAQMLFNGIGVVAIIGFLPIIARALEKLVPETTADRERQQRQLEKQQANAENPQPEPVTR
ncbi:Na/Pi cotransporter family protein [Trichocoleus sp. FACHB-262]|uniref:Na/Pi cotransporter family protein n=1 Tax=Trichocoleus sp. FACHB-262 TaxID=2692869 RepID=UPI001689283C|nr:Na/Pi symporter [Trichocoleus sp. FACHB-262]MBD2124210.1 Na/Pi cotransporter family protein [Trichocoleus sp. FACHB-262]